MTVVKLEWRLLGFAWIFFAVSSAASHTVPEKMIFGSGKSFLIVGEWRLLGFAGTGKLPGKKWFLGWENHFCEIGEWRLVICWDFSFFALSIAAWQTALGRGNDSVKLESGDCWDLLGFLLLRCPGKKWFWVGKITFLKRLLGFAGISPFLRCLLLLGRLPGKKWFLGRGNHFSEIGEWRLLGFAGISSFTVSTAAWRAARKKNDFWVGKIIFLKLETSDCWDLMGFLLLRCPGKKWFLGRENHVSEAISGICWDFSFFALSTATWQTAGKKWFLGRGNHFFCNWRVAIAGICWDFFFYGVDCCLASCPEKKWILGRENNFSEVGDKRLLGFDGISSFAVSTVKETGCISLYWGGYRFFFFLIVLGGWGNVVAWSFYMLMAPLFSQPHILIMFHLLNFVTSILWFLQKNMLPFHQHETIKQPTPNKNLNLSPMNPWVQWKMAVFER